MRLLVCLLLGGPAVAQPPKPHPSDEVFKPGNVWRVKITTDEANAKSLRAEPRKYAKCTLQIGDTVLKDVGIHIKGAAGSTRGWDDKPALTLNLDKFVDKQEFKGLDKFHLNNSVQDGSYMNEIVCSELARKMNLPTARAAHALVELNGRKVGLYVLKEGYNKGFVKRYFPAATGGNLYDGGFLQDINADLKLDSGDPMAKRADLKALAKACQEPDANKRYAAVSKLVDVDRFATNAALQLLACDWDGYMRNRNNYRVYFPPNGGKAVFIPHGMDQMFGNTGDALWHGYGGMVAAALLNHPDGKKLTVAKMKEMFETHMKLDDLNKRVDEWATPAAEALRTVDKNAANGFLNESKNYKERLRQRVEYVKRELPKVK
jgi:spore coat protein CotH